MKDDNIKDIIGDAADLAAHCKDPLTRMALDGIVNRLQTLVDAGICVTPKSAAGVVRAASPEAEARANFSKFLSVPELGTQFMRHRSAAMTQLVATWCNDLDSHIYEVRVVRDGESANAGWRAKATNDGRLVFTLAAKCRSTCERCALSAMKRYLKIGHRRFYRTLRAAAASEGAK